MVGVTARCAMYGAKRVHARGAGLQRASRRSVFITVGLYNIYNNDQDLKISKINLPPGSDSLLVFVKLT